MESAKQTEKEVDAKTPITIECLTKEQKQQMDQATAEFQERCLRCFVMTPQGPVQKIQFPEPMMATLQDIFDQALHRVLSDQSGVLKKDLEDIVKRKINEEITQKDRLGGQPSQHRPEEFPQYRQGEEYYYVQNPTLCRYKDDLADRVAEVVHEHFGIKPKEQVYLYQRPYPEWFDEVPLPYDFQVPEFLQLIRSESDRPMADRLMWDRPIWIGLYMVFIITKEFCRRVGRSGETVPSIFLHRS